MEARSGRAVLQPSGYKAFIPSNLPPNPPIISDVVMEELLQKSDRSLVQLEGVGAALPNPDLFVTMAIRKEALLSAQIEGTRATMTDVLTYETWDEVNRFDDVQDVVNYIKAFKEGISLLDSWPLGVRLIKQLHAILLNATRGSEKHPGEFRRSQNWIGPSLQHALYVPPPSQEVPEAIGALEKFIHQKNALHPLVKAALIHYQFETIHPFLDGNGRMGRLLIDLYLREQKILTRPLLTLSYYLKLYRQEYFDRLMGVRLTGNFEQWILFFLRGLFISSEHSVEKITQILSLQKNLKEQLLKEKSASLHTLRLLDTLFYHPLTTATDLSHLLELSFPTITAQLRLFLRLGILVELTGQRRGKRYAFAPYLQMIEG